MRLFVALSLPDDVMKQVEALRGGIPDARWTPDGNAHLTLAFLGDVPEVELGDLSLALSRIRQESFDLQLETTGVFGNTKRPRILWAGIAPNEPLIRLQQKVVTALGGAGYKLEERRFRPHVTLARIHMSPYEKIRQYLSDNALFKTRSFEIESFTLFSSHLAHTGAIYTEEAIFDLSPATDVPDTSHADITPL